MHARVIRNSNCRSLVNLARNVFRRSGLVEVELRVTVGVIVTWFLYVPVRKIEVEERSRPSDCMKFPSI